MPFSLRPINDGLIYDVSNRVPILGKAAIAPNGVDVMDLVPDRRLLSHLAARFTANRSAR